MGIKDDITSLTWKRWLNRELGVFVLSLFKEGSKKKYYEKLGFHGVDCKAILFQNGIWYESPEVWKDMAEKLGNYLKSHSMFDISRIMENFYKENKKRLKKIVNEENDLTEQLKEIRDILASCIPFIWIAHGLEELYKVGLRDEVCKYVKSDINKFIGDASYPVKKNAHALMEKAILDGENPKLIAKEYGWIKSREKFSDPFSEDDIIALSEILKPVEDPVRPEIPEKLKSLFAEIQELVYFRTARTDMFYEFIFLSRPILKKAGSLFGLSLSDMGHYTIHDIIKGNPKKYNKDRCLAVYEDESYLGEKLIINKEENIKYHNGVNGSIAYKGVVKGVAKVITSTSELDKINEGDVLVTQMTSPSYIAAMNKAIAFVTDEGGITCHAAIVAREMKKPCVIGTRIATRIFKDGDLVEVDADNGIVRKIR